MIETIKIEVRAPVGANGVATQAVTTPGAIVGRVLLIACEYLNTPPGTTDVVVATAGDQGPARTLMSVASATTDFAKQPMVQASNPATGAALAYTTTVHEVYVPPVINDRITVTVDQSDANKGVDVWITVER